MTLSDEARHFCESRRLGDWLGKWESIIVDCFGPVEFRSTELVRSLLADDEWLELSFASSRDPLTLGACYESYVERCSQVIPWQHCDLMRIVFSAAE